MAKKKAKAVSANKDAKPAKAPKSKKPTICSIVLQMLDDNQEVTTQEIYQHLVKNGFPDTKFQKSHLAWYKHQIRKGRYKLPSGAAFKAARKAAPKVAKAAKKAAKKATVKKAKKISK